MGGQFMDVDDIEKEEEEESERWVLKSFILISLDLSCKNKRRQRYKKHRKKSNARLT